MYFCSRISRSQREGKGHLDNFVENIKVVKCHETVGNNTFRYLDMFCMGLEIFLLNFELFLDQSHFL